jgi:hypothetical protein
MRGCARVAIRRIRSGWWVAVRWRALRLGASSAAAPTADLSPLRDHDPSRASTSVDATLGKVEEVPGCAVGPAGAVVYGDGAGPRGRTTPRTSCGSVGVAPPGPPMSHRYRP